MKIKNLVCGASVLLATLSGVKAATTTLAAWNFDNLATGVNSSPQPSTGIGTASALSLTNSSIGFWAGSSSGSSNSWLAGDGWSTNALIGSQGAKFAASTFGYYQIKASFDVYATTNAETYLQVQYTTEGSIWKNANIISAGTSGVLATNTITTNSLVFGSYIILTNNGTAGWDNQVTIDLSGISGVDNDANFAIRIVNASTGTNCLDTTGVVYNSNNPNGDWTFDNVVIQGVSFDTVADWTFESDAAKINNNPPPDISNNVASAACIGFNTSFTFANGVTGSTNSADVLANGAPFSSTGSSGQNVWRVRGAGPGNGWFRGAAIGAQGGQFNVSTVNYSNILVSFDLFSTSQGEGKMCVLYTTDGWVTTNVANNIAYGANPSFIVINSISDPLYSPNTVTGAYFWQTTGQNFYNNIIVDFTGDTNVAGNTNFAFRIVNAATGNDCVGGNSGLYNNSSGNWRFDNVAVSGQYTGSAPPVLTNSPSATVDAPFTITYSDDPAWRSKISAIYVNGTALTNTSYTISAGQIIFNPAKSPVLQLGGLDNIVVNATNYSSTKVAQQVLAGVFAKFTFTQPAAPSASGGTLTVNPSLLISDQYGNPSTNPYANISVTATVSNAVSAGWTLGGTTTQPGVNGGVIFTNLSATLTGSSVVTNAAIIFTVTGGPISVTNSSIFTIGAAPAPFTPGNLAAIQIDTVANNTTFSVIELKPSAANQTKPVNIVPISGTGTNPLRLSSAGSCGKLALSDDGTFLCFAAFQDGSSATADETLNLNRAVGTLNYTNLFNSPVSYVSTSLGGSQARSACSPDNVNFIICDKGGLYINSSLVYQQNNVTTRSFGGATWVQTAKTAIPPVASLYQFESGSATDGSIDWGNPGDNGPVINSSFTPPADSVAQDFYMITNGTGSIILYVLDQNGGSVGTSGIINKWIGSLGGEGAYDWTASGSWTNTDNGDTLFATTNGSGGVYLYYANGSGGVAGNKLIRLTDQTISGLLNITSTNTIYTAPAGTSIEGVTFVPQQTAHATELIPPPILTAQTTAPVSSTFSITTTPDDPAWRSAITGITVNGSVLTNSAYTTNTIGKIVFDPSQSALLQSPGAKTIVISATGYSTNLIIQTLTAGVAAKLVITTQPTAPVADGGRLATQPVVVVQDQYGNVAASTASITNAAVQGTWTLGGTKTKAAVSGTVTFTDLTAFSTNAVTGATISFNSGGLTGVSSSPFNIPAPNQSILGGSMLSGGKFALAFTNDTGLSFSVLATNDLTALITTWPVVGQAIESPAGSGNYQYTNSSATNAQQFYILRQP